MSYGGPGRYGYGNMYRPPQANAPPAVPPPGVMYNPTVVDPYQPHQHQNPNPYHNPYPPNNYIGHPAVPDPASLYQRVSGISNLHNF